MKTSVILTLVTLLSAAVALPAITTNTESVHVVQGENEIGTPKMHRRSSTSTNKDIINAIAAHFTACMESEENIRKYPVYDDRAFGFNYVYTCYGHHSFSLLITLTRALFQIKSLKLAVSL
ncbi:hypothetical protein MGG_16698 [Pyricularia oryzae 70-15]|uniref:Uncharacterized protein n=1 Tax=Pyricularia oryzae (strain 70-15 / ATCC MYA-4617 / FGSC 8958) TaxID=242507 RepID=G4N3G5_PYRO7|nr:uncharacterized protein MGG_16698 [Pyricularia oryzae 70-15]EHA51843.1 hypothetical protein MGG_16698 [Pyricularia oryzae 70-15]